MDYDLYEKEADRSPWKRLFVGRPAVLFAPPQEHDDRRLGFIETGPEAIEFIMNSVQDGHNVMLVGPRGTGKSYMAGQAVKAIRNTPSLGCVAVITIQGDPNKPPSDYFDDAIVFRLVDGGGGQQKVVPQTINAAFFEHALRDEGGFYFRTYERDGEDGRVETDDIILQIKQAGRMVDVDRVVIFWDEGNRSAPAMHNAMLGLLAERTIRRDGRDYRFPPVSCILTRNPDGYDSGSAKMPSPLIDRFASQLFVYSPSIATMVNVIAEKWLEERREELLEEFLRSAARVTSHCTDEEKIFTARMRKVIQQCVPWLLSRESNEDLGEGNAPEHVMLISKEALELRWCLAIGEGYSPRWVEDLLVAVDRFANDLGSLLTDPQVQRLKEAIREPTTACPLEGLKKVVGEVRTEVEASLEGNERPTGERQAHLQVVDQFDDSLPVGVDEERRQTYAPVQRACVHLRELAHRVRSLPEYCDVAPVAGLLALVVLGSWGDARPPAEKPGMQYIPRSMLDVLKEFMKVDRSIERALKVLGDRTRYGTSIRAFVDLLRTLIGESTRKHRGDGPAPIDLEVLRPHLGRLLNHRCEPAFNPDREPARAREKTEALIDIADAVLYRHYDSFRALYQKYAQRSAVG